MSTTEATKTTDVPEAIEPQPEESSYTKAEQAHYHEIKEKEQEVGRLDSTADLAKERAKAAKSRYEEAKSRYEEAASELHVFIRRGPDDQQKLPGMEDCDNNPDWEGLPLSAAGIEGSLAKALAEQEMDTLGQVADWISAGNTVTDIKGIGSEKGEQYADLMEAFWAEHPEYCVDDAESMPNGDDDTEE